MNKASAIPAHAADLTMTVFDGTMKWLWPDDPVDTARYPRIGVARDSAELLEIGRGRYDLFVAGDGDRRLHADHETRVFLEPIDRISLNYLARSHGRAVASVRTTRASDAILDPHLEQILAHADLGCEEIDLSVVHSRLTVERSLAARRLLPPLFRAMLRGARLAEVRFCLTAAPPASIPLLQRFGFRPLERRRPYFDEGAGWMSVCILDLHDRQRLADTGSPLLHAYGEYLPQERTARRAAALRSVPHCPERGA